MLSFEEARTILRSLPGEGRRETVTLMQAGGRVLAADVLLDRDQPGFDRATMDGYAVVPDGEQRCFPVLGTVTAGTFHEGDLGPGQAIRIMTGAPCPPGVAVVPIELTDGGEAEVRVQEDAPLQVTKNVALRGEDGHAGDVILSAGTLLGPATLSAAAMAGATQLEVFVPPRVAIVTTGDEVGGEGAASIRDSNGPLLEAFLSALGCPVVREHARDVEGELEAALARASDGAEVVVTTGGVSMGSRDLVPDTIARLGFETVFHKVRVQPGKPVLVARRPSDGTSFVGLPGNPVSVLATAHIFLLEVLGSYLGGTPARWLELPIARDYVHRGKRHLFLPARLDDGGVDPIDWNGSGDLLAAASGDGLVELPVGASFRAGERITFLPYLGHSPGSRGLLPPREPRA